MKYESLIFAIGSIINIPKSPRELMNGNIRGAFSNANCPNIGGTFAGTPAHVTPVLTNQNAAIRAFIRRPLTLIV